MLAGLLQAAATVATAAAPAALCAYTAGPAVVAVPGRPFTAEPSPDGCVLYAPLVTDSGGAVAVLRNVDGAFRLARTARLRSPALGSALSPDGALLALASRDSVALLDATALREGSGSPAESVVPLGNGVEAIQALFSRDGRLLFVSLEFAHALAVVDVARAQAGEGARAVLGRVPQGGSPVGMALSPDGATLYATSQVAGPAVGGRATCAPEERSGPSHPQGALTVVDVATAASTPDRAVRAAVAAGCNPVRVAVSPDGSHAWVTARGSGELLGFDVADLHGTGEVGRVQAKVGTSPVGVVVTADGRSAWVADSDRFGGGRASLAAVDLSTTPPKVTATRPATGFPRDLRLLPGGGTLAVALFNGRAVRLEPAAP